MKIRAVAIVVSLLAGVTVSAAPRLPRPDHIVIVFEENKSYEEIVDSPNAPYLTQLAKMGASLIFYGFHHPSQPNYFEFFAGTNAIKMTDGSSFTVVDDACVPGMSSTRSLGGLLGKNFLGFAEGGDPSNPTACTIKATNYARKHCPWTFFTDSVSSSRTFDDFKNTPFEKLPLVSMITPNLINDMHSLPTDGPVWSEASPAEIAEQVRNGDTWLKNNLDAFVQWAMKNNSLLIITFGESSRTVEEGETGGKRLAMPKNHVATILVGPMVVPGSNGNDIAYNHYDLLRTIEEMYKLPRIGGSAKAKVITGIWK